MNRGGELAGRGIRGATKSGGGGGRHWLRGGLRAVQISGNEGLTVITQKE
jgi:hypothetical protein